MLSDDDDDDDDAKGTVAQPKPMLAVHCVTNHVIVA